MKRHPQLDLGFSEGIQSTKSKKRSPLPSKAEQLIDGVDWNTYRENVYLLFERAVARYRELFEEGTVERVYQISVWTDPQIRLTAISLETRSHANEVRRVAIERSQIRMDMLRVSQIENLPYHDDVATFHFPMFCTYEHIELQPLDMLNYSYAVNMRKAKIRIETNLLEVIDRIAETGLLKNIPREDVVWIGVNSPDDWYDHVRPYS